MTIMGQGHRGLIGGAMVILAALLVLSGCATFRRESAASTEQLLAAAGFQQRSSGDPAWQQYVATLPPYRLVTRQKDGTLVYAYADPENCHCLWVGEAPEFARYRRLVEQREVDRDLSDAWFNWPGWDVWL